MRWMLSVFAVILFAACTDNQKVPSGVLPQKKMELVLWDMIQADRFSSSFLIKEKDTARRKKETFELYENVFRLHGITLQDFRKSFNFYTSRPDLTRVMFDSISAQAERRKKEIYQPRLKKDSISVKDSLLRRDSLLKAHFLKRKDSLVRDSLLKKSSPAVRDSLIKRSLDRKNPLKAKDSLDAKHAGKEKYFLRRGDSLKADDFLRRRHLLNRRDSLIRER